MIAEPSGVGEGDDGGGVSLGSRGLVIAWALLATWGVVLPATVPAASPGAVFFRMVMASVDG